MTLDANGKLVRLHGYTVGDIVKFTKRQIDREPKYAGEFVIIGFIGGLGIAADRIEMHKYPVGDDPQYVSANFHQIDWVRSPSLDNLPGLDKLRSP